MTPAELLAEHRRIASLLWDLLATHIEAHCCGKPPDDYSHLCPINRDLGDHWCQAHAMVEALEWLLEDRLPRFPADCFWREYFHAPARGAA